MNSRFPVIACGMFALGVTGCNQATSSQKPAAVPTLIAAGPATSPLIPERPQYYGGLPGATPRFTGQHFSQHVRVFLDGTQPADISVHYVNCPVTSLGALRLSVFVANSHTGVPVRRYSQTVVDRRRSDTRWYSITLEGGVVYAAIVEIPSRAGCKSWDLGATTN